MRLIGPFAIDLASAERVAHEVLDRFANAAAGLREGDGSAPGLYLLVDASDTLCGFWITLSDGWLDDGVVGGREPPYVAALLDACTEVVWWERLRVTPVQLGGWRPIVVLEWPAFLADRSMLPPPGVPSSALDASGFARSGGAAADGDWLLPEEPHLARAFDDGRDESPESGVSARVPWTDLPTKRSLITICRGLLRRMRNTHEGSYELLCLPPPEEEGMGVASMPASWRKGIPMDDWVSLAGSVASQVPAHPELGWPLRLPAGRVGFPLTGWLSRDLDVLPTTPADAVAGVLVARDTRSPLLGQVMLALSVTVLVLCAALGLSILTAWMALPRLEVAAAPVVPAVQPAISVCSPDHSRFVEELRCRTYALSHGLDVYDVDCSTLPSDLDLQADWCGLHDRDLDGNVSPSGAPYARLAASQACFEVLKRPYDYAERASQGRRADPTKLLDDSLLKVNSLVAVVSDLDAVCNDNRERIEAKVAGAVLSAYIGGEAGEAAALRDEVFRAAAQGLPAEVATCLRAGRIDGVGQATGYDDLCESAQTPQFSAVASTESHEPHAWTILDGDAYDPAPSVVSRYVRARFAGASSSDNLWKCQARLDSGVEDYRTSARWDLSVPLLGSWSDGGVKTQLQLDAWLLQLREQSGVLASPASMVDPCWVEIDRRLASYQPVYPLLGGLNPEGWPSEEQQVCGQVCAARYHLARAGSSWVTPNADLSVCLDRSPVPEQAPELTGRGRIDALRMPWNQDVGGAWVDPQASDVCAFNMIAQGVLPGVLPEEIPSAAWAGELVGGIGIAGGVSGVAARSAQALSTFGQSRSLATCGAVAAECFAGTFVRVLDEPGVAAHEWRERWRGQVADIARSLPGSLEDQPWCRVIRPYLYEDGQLPEGELDLPCALGVEQARQRMESAIVTLASGAYKESAR